MQTLSWSQVAIFIVAAFTLGRYVRSGEFARAWERSFLWFRPSWWRGKREQRRLAKESVSRVAAMKNAPPPAPRQGRHLPNKFGPGPRDWEQGEV